MGKWLKKIGGEATLPIISHVVNSLSSPNPTINAPSIRAVREGLASKWEDIYPVGSIYMSVNNVNPSTLFGGTWAQIKDKFLLACGDTYNNGAEGGEATNSYTPSGTVDDHELRVSELPPHNHRYYKAANSTDAYTLTTADIPAHTHATDGINGGVGQTGDVVFKVPSEGTSVFVDQTIQTQTSGAAGGGGAHSHGISNELNDTVSTGGGEAHSHGFTGAATTFDNMPPYLAVNVWVRTA